MLKLQYAEKPQKEAMAFENEISKFDCSRTLLPIYT